MSSHENTLPIFEDPTYDKRIEEIITNDILGLQVSDEERTYMDGWLRANTEAQEGKDA
jgi:hypothetical protein